MLYELPAMNVPFYVHIVVTSKESEDDQGRHFVDMSVDTWAVAIDCGWAVDSFNSKLEKLVSHCISHLVDVSFVYEKTDC